MATRTDGNYDFRRFERCVRALGALLPPLSDKSEILNKFEGRIEVRLDSQRKYVPSLREFLCLELAKGQHPFAWEEEALRKFQIFLSEFSEFKEMDPNKRLRDILEIFRSAQLPGLKSTEEEKKEARKYLSLLESGSTLGPDVRKKVDGWACREMMSYVEGFLSFAYKGNDAELVNVATQLIEHLLGGGSGSDSEALLREWMASTKDCFFDSSGKSLFVRGAKKLSDDERKKLFEERPFIKWLVDGYSEESKQPKSGGALIEFFSRLLAFLMALFSFKKSSTGLLR